VTKDRTTIVILAFIPPSVVAVQDQTSFFFHKNSGFSFLRDFTCELIKKYNLSALRDFSRELRMGQHNLDIGFQFNPSTLQRFNCFNDAIRSSRTAQCAHAIPLSFGCRAVALQRVIRASSLLRSPRRSLARTRVLRLSRSLLLDLHQMWDQFVVRLIERSKEQLE
jgi:hypothetical protein